MLRTGRIGKWLAISVSANALALAQLGAEPCAAGASASRDAPALEAGELRVRVLDAEGTPARLAFLELAVLATERTDSREAPDPTSDVRARRDFVRTLGSTGPDGTGAVELPGGARGTTALELRVVHMGFVRLVQRIDPPYPAALELRLPAGGVLDVEPRALRYDPRLYKVFAERVGDEWNGVVAGVDTTRVVFDDVPLAGTYQVHLERGGKRVSRRVSVSGPERVGERVRLRIDELSLPLVTGVALDERGRPLAGALTAELLIAGTERRAPAKPALHGAFDADGMFGLEITSFEDALDLALRARDRSGVELEARVSLPGLELGERHELGTLLFERPPIAVLGRVVDATGAPLARVEVRVLEQDRSGRLRPVREGVWTDSQGRFEVRARVSAGATVLLRARDDAGRAASARGLTPGTDGIELRLE